MVLSRTLSSEEEDAEQRREHHCLPRRARGGCDGLASAAVIFIIVLRVSWLRSILIAGIADAIVVDIDLVSVRDKGAVVFAVEDGVAIIVVLTGIALAIAVGVDLVRVFDDAAVVIGVAHFVIV
jgi:hypothetical protein